MTSDIPSADITRTMEMLSDSWMAAGGGSLAAQAHEALSSALRDGSEGVSCVCPRCSQLGSQATMEPRCLLRRMKCSIPREERQSQGQEQGEGLGVGRHVCNLSPWEAERRENCCKFEASLGYTVRPHLRWEGEGEQNELQMFRGRRF